MQKRILFLLVALFLLCVVQVARAQFPGYHVQHFNNENGMPNSIKGLLQDNNGFVWIATESGLVRFDGMRFVHFNRSENGEAINRLFDVRTTASGRIYLLAEAERFYTVTRNNTLRRIAADSILREQGDVEAHISMAQRLYLRCREKFHSGNLPEWALPGISGIGRSYANTITKLGGNYYYLNQKGTLVAADTSLSRAERIDPQIPRLSKVAGKPAGDSLPVSLIQTPGQIFLRCADSIYELRFSSRNKIARAKPVLYIGGISNIVGLLQLPHLKTTIVATLTDGIYVFRRQDLSTLRLGNRDANVFYAQAPAGADGVLTPKGMIAPGQFVPLRITCSPYNILKTREGTFYLNRRDPYSAAVAHLDTNLQLLREIPAGRNAAFSFRQAKDGRIWMTAENAFLGTIENDSIAWKQQPPGLPDDFRVANFIESGDNRFWIVGNKGLAAVDFNKNTARLFPGLENKSVRALYEDAMGTLWIGTYGNGFYALYRNELVHFPVDPNRYLSYVHVFMPDQSGRIWMTTNHGLFLFDTKDLYSYLVKRDGMPYFFYMDHTDGLATSEFNGGCIPAGIVLQNGKFSLPTMNGLVQFYADSIYPVFPRSDIYVDRIVADTVSLEATAGRIRIPKKLRNLQFHISSPYFGNSYNQSVEYKLDDERDQWHLLDKDYVIELNNISKGEHSIRLRKRSGFGKDQVVARRIDFFVEPVFVETLAFKLLLLTGIAALFYLFYRIRIRLLLEQKKLLEKNVAEATKEQHALIGSLESVVAALESSKDELQKMVQFKEHLAMVVTHDLQSPLRFLSDAMDRLHRHHLAIGGETEELSREIKKTSGNIYQFVADFTVWIKNINVQGHIDPKPVPLRPLLDELKDFFAELQKARGNRLVMELPEGICISTSYQLLKVILRNLIDNANKHTREGLITIRVEEVGGEAIIEISDTGAGISPAVLQKILQHSSDSELFSYGKQTNVLGFGYRFVTDFCKLMGVSLDIRSNVGEGTIVKLYHFRTCAKATTAATPFNV